jgi:hypothetical protein
MTISLCMTYDYMGFVIFCEDDFYLSFLFLALSLQLNGPAMIL